jgi:hypothetical protein
VVQGREGKEDQKVREVYWSFCAGVCCCCCCCCLGLGGEGEEESDFGK